MNQQQIFELLHNILKTHEHSGDKDTAFLSRVPRNSRSAVRWSSNRELGTAARFAQYSVPYSSQTSLRRVED